MGYLLEMVDSFKKSGTLNIAVYRPCESFECDCLYDDLVSELSIYGNVEIINEVFLSSFEAMGKGLTDILVIPELDPVQKKMYALIKRYINDGGAIIIAAKDFFMKDKILDDQFSQFDVNALGGEAYFRATSAFLGIKPYVSDVVPVCASIDREFVADAKDVKVNLLLPKEGAQFCVGSDRVSPQPPVGHVFVERYEVLRNYEAVQGVDEYGRKISSHVTFAQNWENGSRFVIYSSNGENSAIRKHNPLFESVVKAAVGFCSNKIMAVSCAPEYACYRDGESVKATYKLLNTGKKDSEAEVSVVLEDDMGKILLGEKKNISIAAGAEYCEEISWSGAFERDSYKITVKVYNESSLVSKAGNGFVVWKEPVVKNGPTIRVDNKYFSINGKTAIITGTNYYESNIGEAMWVKPNAAKLEEDFKHMAADGINYIRIHYHHAKWFKDYLSKWTGDWFKYYQDVETGYLPSERILRVFDAHIYLSQKYGIIYGGDLFTLIPEELGDPKGWYGVEDYMWFEDKFKAQKDFLKLLIPRYINVPGIAWDLYNEPCGIFNEKFAKTFDDAFYRWSSGIKDYMRKLGDSHVMTVGAEKPDRFGDVIDFNAEHVNYKFINERKADTDKPEIVQECWLDRPPTSEGDEGQLKDMKQAILNIFGAGFSGIAPWQWTNQQRLWCDWRTYVGEIWDDRLGACVRNDSTLKPSGRFYRDFVRLVSGLEFKSFKDGIVKTSGGDLMIRTIDDKETFIRLTGNGEVTRECAPGKINGKTLSLESPGKVDVWYLHTQDADYIKADKASTLKVSAKTAPKKIELCIKPCGESVANISTPASKNFTIDVKDSATYYWYKLVY